MKKQFPKVSFLIPTYNAGQYLDQCLHSIAMQSYPKENIEILLADGGSTDATQAIASRYNVQILKNKKVNAEDGKYVAMKKATGDIIAFLDADNVITSKDWLKKMMQPLIENPDILGVESNYLIAPNFTSINTYATLLVIVDPLARMLASRPTKIERQLNYVVKTFAQGSAPVAGANGFLWRRTILEQHVTNNQLNEANMLYQLTKTQPVKIANIPGIGIYHYYATTFRDYLAKRKKIANKFLRRKAAGATWIDARDKWYFLFACVYLATIIGPTCEAFWQAIKTRNKNWFWHPIAGICTVAIYGYYAFFNKHKGITKDMAFSPQPAQLKTRRKTLQPLVSIIVPTKNSAEFLKACLQSITSQTYKNIELIVVDNHSTDATKKIAKEFTKQVYVKGPERSAQRNYGAKKSHGEYVLFIDSDMELSKEVVASCVDKVLEDKTAKSIIIPEESFGEGFWAQCKRLEKSFYIGVDFIEAARFYDKTIFNKVGGYDEALISGEDWDLSQRVGEISEVERVREMILHNEGKISLLADLKKKYYYAKNITKYTRKNINKLYANDQMNILKRLAIYAKKPGILVKNPDIAIGLIIMKVLEFLFGSIGYIISFI